MVFTGVATGVGAEATVISVVKQLVQVRLTRANARNILVFISIWFYLFSLFMPSTKTAVGVSCQAVVQRLSNSLFVEVLTDKH